jgi:hypothetical protein
VVVVGGGVVVVVGGGGGVVVGGEVGGGLVGAGPDGAGLFGAGMDGTELVVAGLVGFACPDFGCVVVEEDGLDPVGTVSIGVEPFVRARSSVPFVWTVNQLFARPCAPACNREWSPSKKKRA